MLVLTGQIGKGASSWDGYSGNHDAHGTENDAGVMYDILPDRMTAD